MRYHPRYLTATTAPAETRCLCRCLRSDKMTPDGRPLMLATEHGKFEQGTYHPPCSDCLQFQRRQREQPCRRQRDTDRESVLRDLI